VKRPMFTADMNPATSGVFLLEDTPPGACVTSWDLRTNGRDIDADGQRKHRSKRANLVIAGAGSGPLRRQYSLVLAVALQRPGHCRKSSMPTAACGESYG